MQIIFRKNSDQEHGIRIIRADNSSEETTLNSRSFLRHDFGHFAAESELQLQEAYWGSVAQGMALAGKEIRGKEIAIAESLATRIQGLLRNEAGSEEFIRTLKKVQPELITDAIADKIYQRCRGLLGRWRATPFGGEMKLLWPETESVDGKEKQN